MGDTVFCITEELENDLVFLPLTVLLMNFSICLWENLYILFASRVSCDALDSNWVPSDSRI